MRVAARQRRPRFRAARGEDDEMRVQQSPRACIIFASRAILPASIASVFCFSSARRVALFMSSRSRSCRAQIPAPRATAV